MDEAALNLPFLVRDMLLFEGNAAFGLEFNSSADVASDIEINVITRFESSILKFITNATSIPETHSFRIGDIPIAVSIRSTIPDVNVNNVFIQCYLTINGARARLLCQGFLGVFYGLSWPDNPTPVGLQARGKSWYASGAAVGAGNEFNITVPAGEFWIVKAMRARLVTAATVANRRLTLVITHSQSKSIEISAPADQTASKTVEYHFFEGAYPQNDTTGNIQNAPLPLNLLLPSTSSIDSITTGLQAADQWSLITCIIEKFYATFSP